MSQLDAFDRVEGKTLTFWLRDDTAELSIRDLAAELLRETRNCRACFHASPEATLHDMLIVEWISDQFYPMHRHQKSEALMIIDGAMNLRLRIPGLPLSEIYLYIGDGAYIVPGWWHQPRPMGTYVAYREIKLGPFKPEDNELWAE